MGFRESIWPPTQRQRVGLSVLLAFVLVLNPLYLPVLNLDLSERTYSAEPVSIDDGTISVVDSGLPSDPVDGIACSGWSPPAGCAYERLHVQRGDLEVNLMGARVEFDTRYAYHPTETGTAYYRRTAARQPFPETASLEPVDPETVIESVAVSPQELSLRARLGLALGWMQTDQPLPDANRIVDTDDGYAMLIETRRSRFSGGDTVEAGISMLLLWVGLAALWQNYKRLPAEW